MEGIPTWVLYGFAAVAVLSVSGFFSVVMWEKAVEEAEEELGAGDAT